jgi:hypothetical protein
VQWIVHEVSEKSVENEIHSDCPQQLPLFWTKRCVQISKREKCKKKSKGRSRSEQDEYADCWRGTDQAKPRDQEEMNSERGRRRRGQTPARVASAAEMPSQKGSLTPRRHMPPRTKETRRAP